MSCSTFVFANTDANSLTYQIKVGDTVVDSVFVGETIDVLMTLDNFELFSIYDLAYRYDNNIVDLVDKNGNALTEANQIFYKDGDEVGGDGDPVAAYAQGTHGLDIKEEFAMNAQLIAAHIFPQKGLIRFSQNYLGVEESFNDTELASLRFYARTATDEDDVVLRYATKTNSEDNADYRGLTEGLALSKTGYSFGGVTVANPVIPTIVIYECPTLTTAQWNEYTAEWVAPVEGCRGYEFKVYKDGGEIYFETLANDVTSKPLFELIETNAAGTYKFEVKALGGSGSNVVSAEKEIEGIPLKSVENLDLTNKMLTWDPVENADKYTVVVKDLNGNEVYNGDVTDTEKDLKDYITVGDYTITVVAKSNKDLYIDSAAEQTTHSTGSTITGTINYLAPNQSMLKWDEDIAGKVVLTSENEEESPLEATIQADGTFEFTGVPNGKYTVEISRPTATTRTFAEKLELTKSVAKNIGKEYTDNSVVKYKAITIFLGNVVEFDDKGNYDEYMGIQAEDLSELISKNGVTDTKPAYSKVMDYVKEAVQGVPGVIDADEIYIGILNYYKDKDTYDYDDTYLDEYDFTIK